MSRATSPVSFRGAAARLSRWRARIALAAAVFSSLLVGVTAFTATANAAASDCNGGAQACFWYDANYSNLRTDYYNLSFNGCYNFSSTFNDKISSVVNRTGWVLVLYKDANCSNFIIGTYEVYPNSSASNLSGSGMNDSASSFKMVSGF